MSITNLEIKFSKVGIHTANQPSQTSYMPVAVLQFDNQPKKKRVYLEGLLFDKKSVKQVFAGETFIVLLIDNDFRIYDLEGAMQGSVSIEEYGELIQVDERSFVLCKKKTATWISDKGTVQGSRELTDEEYKLFYEQ